MGQCLDMIRNRNCRHGVAKIAENSFVDMKGSEDIRKELHVHKYIIYIYIYIYIYIFRIYDIKWSKKGKIEKQSS